jgi:hypothetical protein
MDRLEAVVEQSQELKWRSQAAIISLANARYPRAASLWSDEALQHEELRLRTMLDTLPFVSPGPIFFAQNADLSWPIEQTVTSFSTLIQAPDVSVKLLFESALCHFERGDTQTAESQLRQILEIHPETKMRQVVVTYLHLMTEEQLEIEIPIFLDMFALDKGSQQRPIQESSEKKSENQD